MSVWSDIWSGAKELAKEFAKATWESLQEIAKQNPSMFIVMNWARIALADGIYEAENQIAKHVRGASETQLQETDEAFRTLIGAMHTEGQLDRVAIYGQLYEYFKQRVNRQKQ